ncbi:MAG: hypothetical protein GVY18_08345 [Bacteroidetes bacterium]|jgi:hypothetical protein|nr:hypothetical protein [Bacteroidota bacterium]
MTYLRALLLISVMALLCAACDSDPVGVEPDTVNGDVSSYLQDLPSWSTFAPAEPNQDPTPTGDPVDEESVELNVEKVDEDGNVYTEENVVYSCQVQPFTLTQNPEQIAMYSPDREILWAGSLIQGKSHRDGLGSLLGLPIAERAPINVSIPSLANDDNFRTVDQPTQAEVDQAIGSMIGGATRSGLSTPSTIAFELQTYHSEQQSALQMGLSGRYLDYEGSASGSIDRNVSETTVTAQFYQKMYTVVVEPPQSPGNFFSEGFTEARLQQQVDQGRIGPNNLPVYVSNVVYGRMMMFSLTSTASEEDIRATMQAGYESIGGSVEANLSAKQQEILQQSKIKVTSIGGDDDATLRVIRSGDWSQYFTANVALSSASPLSYTFRNLGDGSIASVTEATAYNIKTCTARQATPGTFDLRDAATLSVPISTPFSTTTADVDGDGNDDLVFNHRSATNEIAVAFSNGDGTFVAPQASTHPASPEGGWATADFVTADLENDGSTALIWSRVGNANGDNTTYVARASGRALEFLEGVTHPDTPSQGGSWDAYRTLVGDMDGDGDDDLVWNLLGGRNRTFVGFSNGDGTFTLPTTSQNQGSTWFPYQAFVGDVTNDNKADMIWSVTTSANNGWYVGESLLQPNTDPGDDEYFDLEYNDRGGNGWDDYVTFAGDIDGRNGTDLIFINPTYPGNRAAVHRVLSDGNGSFTPTRGTFMRPAVAAADIRLADVTADGRSDLVAFDRSTPSVYVGLGTRDGIFDFSRIEQTLPPDDWSQFTFVTGDFNGDGLQDVLWTNETSNSRFYIGLAREDDAL